MTSRQRANQLATRHSQRLWAAICDELRQARLMSGANQADVARHIGVSRYRVGRLERSQLTSASVEYLSRHAAAVGLRLSVKLYPVGGGLRDAAQARYISRFLARIGKAWRVRLEVPIPIPGDLQIGRAHV